MEAYDDGESCKLVGIFMLPLLSKKYSFNNIRLYRMTDFQSLETFVDNKQKNIKKKN